MHISPSQRFSSPRAITERVGLPESDLAGLGPIESFCPEPFDRMMAMRGPKSEMYVQPAETDRGPVVEVMDPSTVVQLSQTTSTQELLAEREPVFALQMDDKFGKDELGWVMSEYLTGIRKVVPRVVLAPTESDQLWAYVFDGGNGTTEEGVENFKSGYANYTDAVLEVAESKGWVINDFRPSPGQS